MKQTRVSQLAPLHPNFSHQAKLFDPRRKTRVVLAGAGQIGSWCALLLAKLGFDDLEVWDGDTISSHNSPMSLYGPIHVGRRKVDVLRELVHALTGVAISARPEHLKNRLIDSPILIMCIDEMEGATGREGLWKQALRSPKVKLVCDSRVAGAYIDVLTVRKSFDKERKRYEKLSFADKDAAEQLCGSHGIAFAAVRAAGAIASNVARFQMSGTVRWRTTERADLLEPVF